MNRNPILPSYKYIIAIDFDETITKSKYGSETIELRDCVKDVINLLHNEYNYIIIIWTCRNSVKDVTEAIKVLDDNGIHYDYFNENCKEAIELFGNDSRKICADIYIDDRGLNFDIDWNWWDIYDEIMEKIYNI
jgi:hypothetical protein